MSTEWLKGCEVCNAGLCKKMDALIESGLSQRKAAKVLVEEQKETLGQVVYSANALRHRYCDHTNKSRRGGRYAQIQRIQGIQ